MEEDILQVVKYCTDLIDDKDLEKLDLIIKYMKRYSVHYRGLYVLPAFCRCASFRHLTSISFPQTHAAVGGVCVEHGLRLHPGQRAGGGAAGLRQHLKDNMKAKVYWFSKSSESSKSWLFFTSKVTTLQLSPKRSQLVSWDTNNRLDTFAEDHFFLETLINKRLIETRELHSEFIHLANGGNRSSF